MSATRHNCALPVDRDRLAALWLGELAPEEEALLDEQLMSCPACGGESARFGEVIAGLRKVVHRERMLPVISREYWRILENEGFKISSVEAWPSVPVDVTFAAGLEIVMIRMKAALQPGTRYDLELFETNGNVALRVEDVPVAETHDEIVVACQRHYLDSFAHLRDPKWRLLHGRSVVGEYVLMHGHG